MNQFSNPMSVSSLAQTASGYSNPFMQNTSTPRLYDAYSTNSSTSSTSNTTNNNSNNNNNNNSSSLQSAHLQHHTTSSSPSNNSSSHHHNHHSRASIHQYNNMLPTTQQPLSNINTSNGKFTNI